MSSCTINIISGKKCWLTAVPPNRSSLNFVQSMGSWSQSQELIQMHVIHWKLLGWIFSLLQVIPSGVTITNQGRTLCFYGVKQLSGTYTESLLTQSSCSNDINKKSWFFFFYLCWQCHLTPPFPSSSWWLVLSSSPSSQPIPLIYHKENRVCRCCIKTWACCWN